MAASAPVHQHAESSTLLDLEADLARVARRLGGLTRTEREEVLLAAAEGGDAPGTRILIDILTSRASTEALAPALVRLETAATPAAARAAQATENAWRSIDDEFGLLTSGEVAMMLGARASNRSYASDQRTSRKLLGIRRKNSYLYPGFQFDRITGSIRPVMPRLLAAAAEAGRSDEGVALWLMGPTTSLAGGRPVDHLDDAERILEVAGDMWRADW